VSQLPTIHPQPASRLVLNIVVLVSLLAVFANLALAQGAGTADLGSTAPRAIAAHQSKSSSP